MNDELEFGTAASSDTPEPAVELNKQTESVPEAPVQRVSAHNTAAAAALNAANEEVDIRRKGGEKAQIKIKTTKIPYEKKKGLYGYGFIALWFIGTLWLFIIPVLTSLWYSLCDTQLLAKADALEKGMTSAGIYTEFNGFKNFVNAFTVDTEFLPPEHSGNHDLLAVHRRNPEPEVQRKDPRPCDILPAGSDRDWSCYQRNQR